MKKLKYEHTGEGGPVYAHDVNHAAEILARREYGRRGTVGALRLDSWAMDGSSHTYEAFIGRSYDQRGDYSVTGHNIWIYV